LRVDGEKVRHGRERLALSIDAASNVAGVAPQTWLRAEHGGELRPSSVRRIAEALGAAPENLLGKAPAQPSHEAGLTPVGKSVTLRWNVEVIAREVTDLVLERIKRGEDTRTIESEVSQLLKRRFPAA